MEQFHYLEGFSNYGVTSDGRVFNHKTNRWIGNVAPGNYSSLSLRADNGDTCNTSRHRIVAMLFVSGRSEERNIVNHINGIPGDDRPENLEWITYLGNHEHAGMLGLTDRCIPVSMRNPTTGEIIHFPSALKAGAYSGLSKDAVLWRLENDENRIYPEGFQYRKRDDSRPWAESTNSQFGRTVATLLYDIITGEVREYEKQSDISRDINCCLSTINVSASSGDQRLLNNRYMVKLKNDTNPWRVVEDVYREHGLKKAVKVINDVTGEERIFPSARACAVELGILTTTLNERLNKNGSKSYNGFRFVRY